MINYLYGLMIFQYVESAEMSELLEEILRPYTTIHGWLEFWKGINFTAAVVWYRAIMF